RQFRRTARHALSELEEAAAQRDARRASEIAHRLASSASALGFVRLGRLAGRSEQAASRGEPSQLAALTTLLGIEFERTLEALRDMLREARAPRRTRQPQVTMASSL